MSATIARCTASAFAKRAAKKPLVIVRVYGTTPLAAPATIREERAQNDRSNKHRVSNYEFQDFPSNESTLENALEMSQLGTEQESASYWAQVVRSAYRRRGISKSISSICSKSWTFNCHLCRTNETLSRCCVVFFDWVETPHVREREQVHQCRCDRLQLIH
jgi:hypothetical protein